VTVYLTVDQVIQINQEMVESFGGLAGLRDRGALEAAVSRQGHSAGRVRKSALDSWFRMHLVPR
jgi:prophage maintenance system killer protein